MLQTLKKMFTGNELSHAAIQHAMDEATWTPDLALVEMNSEYVFVFEYADMLSTEQNHSFLKSRESFTAYTMYRYSHLLDKEVGSSVILKEGFYNIPKSKVKGEIHLIPSDHLKVLDRYRQNGVQFMREKRRVIVMGQRSPLYVDAFIYVGCIDFWKDQIDWDLSYYRENGGSTFRRCEEGKDPRLSMFPDSRYYSYFKRPEESYRPGPEPETVAARYVIGAGTTFAARERLKKLNLDLCKREDAK